MIHHVKYPSFWAVPTSQPTNSACSSPQLRVCSAQHTCKVCETVGQIRGRVRPFLLWVWFQKGTASSMEVCTGTLDPRMPAGAQRGPQWPQEEKGGGVRNDCRTLRPVGQRTPPVQITKPLRGVQHPPKSGSRSFHRHPALG